jgi:hypothetical protein
MSLSKDDIVDALERIEYQGKYEQYPIMIDTSYKKVDSTQHEEWDNYGYCVKISSYVNGSKYENEVLFEKSTDIHVVRSILNNALDELKETVWKNTVMGDY